MSVTFGKGYVPPKVKGGKGRAHFAECLSLSTTFGKDCFGEPVIKSMRSQAWFEYVTAKKYRTWGGTAGSRSGSEMQIFPNMMTF